MLLPFLAPRPLAEIEREMNDTATGFGDGTVSVIARSGRKSKVLMEMVSRDGRGMISYQDERGKLFAEWDRSRARLLDTINGVRKLVPFTSDGVTTIGLPETATEDSDPGFKFKLENDRVRMSFSQGISVRSETLRRGVRTIELQHADPIENPGRVVLRYRVGTFFPLECRTIMPGERNDGTLSIEFQRGRVELSQLRIPDDLWSAYPDKQDR